MKNIFFLIVCCLGLNGLFAQEYYLKVINVDNTGTDNGLDIIADETSYVVLCGSVTAVSGIGIFKTDLEGNKIWDNQVDFYPYNAGVTNLIKLPNESYLISGGRVELGLDFQDLFTFVNQNGFIYRHVTHGDSVNNRSPESLIRDDKIIAYTSVGEIEPYNNHPLLITLDTTGTILREDTLNNVVGYPNNGSADLILLSTGEYVLGIGAQNEPDKIYGYLRKTDTIGTTIWEKKINDYQSLTAPLHLAALQNGNFVVSWGQMASGNQEYGTFVRCYNSAGDSLWQYTFSITAAGYGRNIQDLHVCINGDIIGCGYTGNFSLTGSPTCWLFRLSSSGQLLWMREYVYWASAGQTMQLFGVTEDPYGDIVATGFAILPDDSGFWTPQAVLLKVNSQGCFGADGCNDSTIVYSLVTGLDEPPPLSGVGLPTVRVLPTSVSGEFLLLYRLPSAAPARLLLYDLAGRLVAQRSLVADEVFAAWSLPTVPPAGLYVYVAEQSGEVVARGKVLLR